MTNNNLEHKQKSETVSLILLLVQVENLHRLLARRPLLGRIPEGSHNPPRRCEEIEDEAYFFEFVDHKLDRHVASERFLNFAFAVFLRCSCPARILWRVEI